MEGIIKSLGIEEIAKEIKELIGTLEGAKTGLVDFGVKVTDALKQAGDALKEVKTAASFSELNTAAKKATQNVEELTAAQKEYAAQQKTIETLTAKLSAMENQEAVAVQKLRLEIAEKNRQNKIEAEAQISATKAMNDYSVVLSKSAKSVNELREQNKQLRNIVNNLNIETQAAEIAKLNKVIDGNTAIIQMNKDSYTQQKMNIGNYKSALEGVTAQIQLTIDKMKAMQSSGASGASVVEQSKKYKELEETLAKLTKQQADYETQVQELIESQDKLTPKLETIKKEMTQLALKGSNTWSEEEAQRYNKLRGEAEKLQRAINAVNTQVSDLAVNNIEMRAMAETFSIATAGSQLFEEEMNALGISNKSYQDTLVQLQRAQATINSLETLSAKLKANSTIQVYLQTVAEKGNTVQKKAATVAQLALNKAQAAMPYLAIAAALLFVTKALFDYAVNASQAAKDQKMFNEIRTKSVELYAKEAAQLNVLAKLVKEGNLSAKQQADIITKLNKVVEKTGGHFEKWEEAEDFLIKNKDAYIQAMAERAYQMQLLTEYTELYTKKRKKEEEGINIGFWDHAAAGLDNYLKLMRYNFDLMGTTAYVTSNYNKELEEMDIQMNKILGKITDSGGNDDAVKRAEELVKSLQVWNNTEIQNLTIKYNEEKALLEQHGKDTTLLTKKYQSDVSAIHQKAAGEQQQLIEKINGLRIQALAEGKEKELAALAAAQAKETAAVTGNAKQREEQLALIEAIYRKKRLQLEQDNKMALNDAQIAASQLRLASIKEGTMEEYNERMRIWTLERDSEILMATETGASIADIEAKYAELSKQVMADLVEARIATAEEELAARLRIAEEALTVEEAALLEKYKQGKINEKQYNEGIAALRHQFSVKAAQDEIDALQKVLDSEEFTEEQRKAINDKLYAAKKALSDEETSHELSNIEKVTAARKAAAEKAKELAKEAFAMTMDYLAQQSEAKIEEFDAELERIQEWQDRELERLDESVMSDETRAAETKRINEKAEADRKKVEEEKHKEQEKAFHIQQATSVAQTLMNTGQAIMSIWAQVPKFDFGVSATALTIATSALGAAQVAMILAQKPPKYAHGIYDDESHPGGLAIVGDAGKREYGVLPSGRLFETPAAPTLIDIPKGTQVFPDYMTLIKHLNPVPAFEGREPVNYEFKEMERNIVRAIEKNRTVQSVSIDENGIITLTKRNSGKTNYINRNVTIKK